MKPRNLLRLNATAENVVLKVSRTTNHDLFDDSVIIIEFQILQVRGKLEFSRTTLGDLFPSVTTGLFSGGMLFSLTCHTHEFISRFDVSMYPRSVGFPPGAQS